MQEGTLLGGRYRIGRLLGAGGMGAVHEAVDERVGGVVAVKILRADRADPTSIERFRREAQAAASLGHPHIVRVTDFQARAPEPPFLVMERVEGVSLRHLLARDGRMPPRRACSIAAQILSALAAAHEAGILHRDVKPANVLVMQSPAGDLVKVTDFGIARRLDADATITLARPASMRLTGSNDVLGTIGFIAPEQLRGEPCDARADLYGVGATLFQMLAFVRPFDGMTPEQYVAAALAGPPFLDADALSIDRALADVVMKAMAPSPADRFSSAGALISALERWTDPRVVAPTVPMQARAPTPAPLHELVVVQRPTPEGGSRAVSWIIVVVAILALVVVASLLAKVRRAQDSGVEIHAPR